MPSQKPESGDATAGYFSQGEILRQYFPFQAECQNGMSTGPGEEKEGGGGRIEFTRPTERDNAAMGSGHLTRFGPEADLI